MASFPVWRGAVWRVLRAQRAFGSAWKAVGLSTVELAFLLGPRAFGQGPLGWVGELVQRAG